MWSRTWGSGWFDAGRCVEETNEGGYIVTGEMHDEYGLAYLYLLKTDAGGDSLWARGYEIPYGSSGYCVQQTDEGGYIIVGWAHPNFYKGYDVWLLKTDEKGDALWTHLYGGKGVDFGYELDQTSDGGYIIVGETKSFGGGTTDLWLIKTDSLGDIPLEISCSKIIVPEEGEDIDSMIPYAHFTNLSTKNYPQPFYCHCEITDFSFHSEVYHDSVLIQKGLNPWETVEKIEYTGVKFAEWKAEGISDYEAVFYATSAEGDSLPTRPMSVTFRWTGIEEQPPVTPVTHLSNWQISASIGPQITLRYTDCPEGFSASIFDAMGRKVDELHSSDASGTITWGKWHRPGVYFIRMEGERSSPAQKMILVR